MPLQATSGAASYDGFGGGVAAVPNYIEDVFSTWLYTGNGSTQTITNGIDLSTKGGLVWSKSRSTADNNVLLDTVRGANSILVSNTTAAASISGTPYVTASTTGYSIGTSNSQINGSGNTYASWTFRKQPKFFDVVTYTGNGTSQNIAHSLGAVPGSIFVKKTSGVDNWGVYHRSIGNTKHLRLNTTDAEVATTLWNNTDPTSTQFSVSGNYTNESGFTYVAYLFAHNAGGFGLTGTDNVISCGSFTTDASGQATVTLGYEPQWTLIKASSTTSQWQLRDVMRGMSMTRTNILYPNLSNAEDASPTPEVQPTATGFFVTGNGHGPNQTFIYIAIRRGPMKVPTSGTSVFSPIKQTGGQTQGTKLTTSFPVDMQIGFKVDGTVNRVNTRLIDCVTINTGRASRALETNSTAAESTTNFTSQGWDNTGFCIANNFESGALPIYWNFSRAPSFFDEVCYTGTGAVRTINHNLGVAPEMMIVKVRGANSGSWRVYHSALGPTKLATLNLTNAAATLSTIWNNTAPTASVFTVGTYGEVNLSGDNFVAYLFASCTGVSQVGSYTGTGATQTISCGFTGGARWVMVKRTDSTGDWYVWDTARGMVAGTDPSLLLNSTAAEVNANSIYTTTGGFQIVSTAAGINASGGTYIYLAIA